MDGIFVGFEVESPLMVLAGDDVSFDRCFGTWLLLSVWPISLLWFSLPVRGSRVTVLNVGVRVVDISWFHRFLICLYTLLQNL